MKYPLIINYFFHFCENNSINPPNSLQKNKKFNITIEALKAGNQKVFEKVYAENYGKLCAFLLSYCNDKNIVEDVVQDVFLKLWTNRKDLNINTSLSGYLTRASYNKLMDNYRNVKKKNSMLSSYYYTAMMQAIEPDAKFKNKKLKALDKCIDELPARCKVVFYENKIKGLKYHEVADKLDISMKTVEGHISRALGILRKCMQKT
ncbi:RNA polymerase sigma factor [Thalassobellus citreus]|uniref:RNA polymerase sigma factor n=1 Tax=Thalassobellus citreus TaxID=3367752 RepID=UPI003795D1C7